MIEIFRVEQTRGAYNVGELYYVGKNQKTYDEFVGGRQFKSEDFYEIVFDALNYLEEKGYKVISVVYNPTTFGDKAYEIFTGGS